MASRIFVVDGREFPDPDPNLSADEVRKMWTDFFPELANAEVREHKRGEDTLYELIKRVGTKG
jgi:PRTRC genetic system protein C